MSSPLRLRYGMRSRLRFFLMLTGVALIMGGLLEFGAGRFDVTSPDGQRVQCSSVFSSSDGFEYLSVDGHPMSDPANTWSDALCDLERVSRQMWLWSLLPLGVVLVSGGAGRLGDRPYQEPHEARNPFTHSWLRRKIFRGREARTNRTEFEVLGTGQQMNARKMVEDSASLAIAPVKAFIEVVNQH